MGRNHISRNHLVAAGLAFLALPALAQDHAFQYQDEQGSAWSDEPPPPGEGSYSEYQAPAAGTNVDVSVDLASPGANVTFDTFRDGLAPYGEWVNDPRYGSVWRPAHVATNWRPYYYGRWEWTDEGWLWVSDEPWGWAAYHYGRWTYDGSYGWVWIPGYQWAPAWVSWRYSPDYIGWAPLGPGLSVYVTSYPAVYGWWTFVPCHRFVGVPVWSAAFGGSHVRGIFHATLPAPPRAAVYGATAPAWGGPARPFVERRIGHAIAPVRVQPVSSPTAAGGHAARAGVVPIYRPEVRAAPGGRPVGAPAGRGPAPAAMASPQPQRPAAAPGGTVGGRPWGGTAGAMRSGPPAAAPAQGGRAGHAPPAPAQGGRAGYAPAPAQGGRSGYVPAPAQGGGASAAPRYAPAPAQPRQPAPAPRPQGGGSGPQGFVPRPQGGAGSQGFAPRGQGATVARPQFSAPSAPRGGGQLAAPRAGSAPAAPRFGGGGGGAPRFGSGGGAPRSSIAHGGGGQAASGHGGGHRR